MSCALEKIIMTEASKHVNVRILLRIFFLYTVNNITGGLSGLRQFLANEIPLEMMKNAFYFTSKALFVLEIFKFLS